MEKGCNEHTRLTHQPAPCNSSKPPKGECRKSGKGNGGLKTRDKKPVPFIVGSLRFFGRTAHVPAAAGGGHGERETVNPTLQGGGYSAVSHGPRFGFGVSRRGRGRGRGRNAAGQIQAGTPMIPPTPEEADFAIGIEVTIEK